MDMRAAKLALARKKLKDHQEKKLFSVNKDEESNVLENNDIVNLSMNNECHTEQSFNLNDYDNEQLYVPNLNSAKNYVDTESEAPESECVQPDVNVTEILISNKRNLEVQITELQLKLSQLEHNYAIAVNNYNVSNQKISNLEKELAILITNSMQAAQDIISKDRIINEFNHLQSQWCEEKSNLQEQLELTKNILSAKERENDSLHSHVYNLQNQLEVTQLQLQQLTNGLSGVNSSLNPSGTSNEQCEALLHKISALEQQLKASLKEREQVKLHYEQYVNELNEQLKSVLKSNEKLSKQVHDLSNRETSLIDQISEMEIRMQAISASKVPQQKQVSKQADSTEFQQNYIRVQEQLRDLSIQFEELQTQLAHRNAEIQELTQKQELDSSHDTISVAKLSADIASDKIAAQRATEQNKKLKQDVQRLEDAFIKMSRDKLELTEKITAEKYLNKELTIKLAEVEEKAKDMFIKLKAKDDEMIRLQASCRDMEYKLEQMSNSADMKMSNTLDTVEQVSNVDDTCINGAHEEVECSVAAQVDSCENVHEYSPLINNKQCIRKEDAMSKLQERFLKIMDEVANLSDEKHRLEHIIVQLQNETDTICEYVALYQQQRSLLKKRDEERNAHITLFKQECDKLKSHIDELTKILTSFANDKELASYFEIESKQNNLQQVMILLNNVKNNSLLDFNNKNLDFKNFHPCSCCSGQLINV